MPGELTTFHTGSADPAESLRNLLEVMQNAHEADLSAEEKLNQIKIANATKLAALSNENQKKYLDAYESAAKKQIAAEHKKHKDTITALKAEVAIKSGEELKALNRKIKAEQKALKATEKAEEKAFKKRRQFEKELRQERAKEATSTLLGSGKTLKERKDALKTLTHDENGKFSFKETFANLGNAINDMAKQLNGKIDEIYSYKGAIDTRLQGLRGTGGFSGGSSQ